MGLFGKKKGAEQIKMPVYDAEGIGLTDMKKSMASSVKQQRATSDYFGSMIPGLIDEFDRDPVLSAGDQTQLTDASNAFGQQLRNSQLNAMNVAGNQIGGAMSALAGKGMSSMGAGAANIKAGVLAGQQASLNQAATQQTMAMLEMRNNLLQGVRDRMMGKMSWISSQQAQADSQSAANLGTLLGSNASQMKLEADVNSYNAQLRTASGSKGGGLFGGILSGAIGGAGAGSAAGPWGALAGAVGGGVLGGLGSSK